MLKNTLQFIRHNLRSGKAIMVLLSVVMIICGPVPAFMVFSDRLRHINMLVGSEKLSYAKSIEAFLLRLFDMSGPAYYHVLLSLIAAVSGLVLAFILFYYFRKKESCDFFLSLPLTRTEGYIANFVSGILYYVIPLAVSSLVTVIGLSVMGATDYLNIAKLLSDSPDHTGMLSVLGTNLVFFLLFFALGTVASLLSSNGINALVVYGTMNLYPIVFMFLLTGAAHIFNNDIVDFQETILEGCLYITPALRLLIFYEVPPTVWTYVLTPVVAAAFAVLGCYLCNKRPAETWSSAIIFTPVRLVLQYMYCFIVAFASGLFFYYVADRSVFNIVIGAILGLVLSFMILNIIFERDVKAIFRKPLRLVWSAVIFIAVFTVIVMDVFGIFRYRQPSFSSVDYVNVSLTNNIVNSYYSNAMTQDFGVNKIEDAEAKEAAIKLFSLLHEETRNNNYDYYLGRTNTLSQFDSIVQSHTSGINVELDMMRNGKSIRPLRDWYFEKDEEYYDLFKIIYDSDDYLDPMIPLLTYAEIKSAEVTTIIERQYGGGKYFPINSKDSGKRLREALLADYQETDFDALQSLSPYILNLYYDVAPGKYKEDYGRPKATVEYSGNSYVTAENSIGFPIPEGFTRTIAIIEENPAIATTFEEYHAEVYGRIAQIVIQKYSADGETISEVTTVTEKDEIMRILDDTYFSSGRSMTFPKYGVVINIHLNSEDDSAEREKYYYEDRYDREFVAYTEFLERFSTLY